MTQMWDTIAAERGALADDLAGLGDAEWQTPSLCRDWTVREALAHMASTGRITPLSFVTGLAASGFRFQKFADEGIRRNLGATPADTLAGFRAIQHSTSSPPGPKVSWLGETIVHAEDIRKPLGIQRDYHTALLRQLAEFYAGSNALIGTKKRIEGLRLDATDTDWHHGNGALVEGTLLALLMGMTGRRAYVDELSGPGVETLRSRCP